MHGIKRGLVKTLIICICFALFIRHDSQFIGVGRGEAYMRSFYIEQKHFNTVDKARQYIKGIPFIAPAYIPKGYKLKDITYTKRRSLNNEVRFSYIDKCYNELIIDYYEKDESRAIDSLLDFDYEAIRIINKSLELDLQRYSFYTAISYSSIIPKGDNTEDSELIKIANGYLNSAINDLSIEKMGKLKFGTYIYQNFIDLNKDMVYTKRIIEPSYIPEGFNLKQILCFKANDEFFSVVAVKAEYENALKETIYLEYVFNGAFNGEFGSCNDIDTVDIYGISLNKYHEKGAILMPAGKQKSLKYKHSDYDINISFRYKGGDSSLGVNADRLLLKIALSISKK